MESGVEVGPEYEDSGDPAWVRPELREGGAFPGDMYVAWGRWRERIYPDETAPEFRRPLEVGTAGLRNAVIRLGHASNPPRQTPDGPDSLPDPLTAITATYDALEWVHSLDEHLKKSGRYGAATDIEADLGRYVEGAIGARNASHHGIRPVIGISQVGSPLYEAKGDRWVHSDTYGEGRPQLRWVRSLPARVEEVEAGGPLLYSPAQIRAFISHLAGREVTNTFKGIYAFFTLVVPELEVPPGVFFTPGSVPPPIDPRQLTSERRTPGLQRSPSDDLDLGERGE